MDVEAAGPFFDGLGLSSNGGLDGVCRASTHSPGDARAASRSAMGTVPRTGRGCTDIPISNAGLPVAMSTCVLIRAPVAMGSESLASVEVSDGQ